MSSERRERLDLTSPWLIVGLLAATTILHILLAFRFPMAPDETYYWEWSRRLDWGYYDQGPMIAWAIRASCSLLGDTEIGIRMTAVLASLIGQIFLYFFTKDLFGRRIAFISLLPISVTPVALASGFLATYDPIVVMFWSIALYFLSRAVFYKQPWAWIWVGFALGLGALSKYTMFFFLPCLALYLLSTSEHRAALRSPHIWMGLIIGGLILAPNIWWLSQHDWITLAHIDQLTASRATRPVIARMGDYIGSQVAILTPIVFALAVISLIWTAKRQGSSRNNRTWLLFCFSVPILVFVFLETFRGTVLGNWPILGWITAPAAIAVWMESVREHRDQYRKRAIAYISSLALAAVASLVMVFPESLRAVGIRTPVEWSKLVNRFWGGRELAEAVERAHGEMVSEVGGAVAIGGTHYDTSGRLAFYLEGNPETMCLFLGTRLNQYIYWNHKNAPQSGGAMLVVGDYPFDDPRRPPYEQIFDRVESIDPPVDIFRRPLFDEPVRKYYLYRCYGFRMDESAISPRLSPNR